MVNQNKAWFSVTRRVLALVLFAIAIASESAHAQNSFTPSSPSSSTPAGTMIFNRARLRYTEPDGGEAEAVTRTVVVTVMVVNGVAVTPDESASSGTVEYNERVTVSFNVCNTGNNSLPYVLTEASVTAPAAIESIFLDADSSGTVTDDDLSLALNTTRTPEIAPSACKGVLLTYLVNGASGQSQLSAFVRARSAPEASGNAVEDTGTIIRTVKERPIIADPDDASLPPRKSVNGQMEVTVASNTVVQFEVAFRNFGDRAARDVVMRDELPQGLTFEPDTLQLVKGSQVTALTENKDADAGVVIGQSIEVGVPMVESQEVVRIRFRARVAQLPGGTLLINRAQVSAQNAPLVWSREARVLVAPQGMVFDGGAGSASPVRAQLRIVAGDERGPLVGLTPATGFIPNDANANPFVTGADGLYSFRISSPQAPAVYYLLVESDGYKPRSIECLVTPEASGRYHLTLKAQDGQPLAIAGGYTLTDQAVQISNLSAFVSNIPVFSTGELQIVKTADRRSATIGDVVTYRVEVRNTARAASFGVEVSDQLPQSFYYVPGSGHLQVTGAGARTIEPEIAGDTLTFRLQTIPGGGSATLHYRVRIGANARLGEQFNVAIARSGQNQTQPTRVGVVVREGIFSTNQFIIGRVFVDVNGDGAFDAGDKGVAGARLITQNGRVVLTDADGNYNIPVVGSGVVVLQLDHSSVPEGLTPRDERRVDGTTWSRLLATPLSGGAMLRSDFALSGNAAQSASEAPAHGGGHGRLGESVSQIGRRDADSPVQSSPAQPAVKKKRGHWLRRLVRSVFSRSKDEANSSAAKTKEYSSPPSAPASSVAPPPPAQQMVAAPESRQPSIVPVKHLVEIPLSQPSITFPSPAPAGEAASVPKVAPGNIELDVEPDLVSLKPALNVPVRVAAGWNVHLYLNDARVDSARVGERRSDQATQTDQLTFIGLDLIPGPNRLRAVAVAPDGTERAMREVVVYGRGPAVRFEIVPEVSEIPAGRRSYTILAVKAFDGWGNPAQDAEVALQTNLGAISDSSQQAHPAAPAPFTGASVDSVLSRQGLESAPAIQQQAALKLVGGRGVVRLESADAPGTARVTVTGGAASAYTEVRFGVEQSPRMMVGYGQLTIGRAAPVMSLRGVDDRTWRASGGFFFRGSLSKGHTLTLAYDTDRPLQRLDARDRLFQIDPLEHAYQVFGDTSTRFSLAQSNTKVYARLDLSRYYGRSYLLFGDYMPEKRDTELSAYNRRITGALFHFENSHGDYVSFGGAHPDTLFGRDVFPGSQFGFARLSASLILSGSENVWLEVRDRRNPDLIIEREQLTRGVDYNLDADSGQIFFKRDISAFDPDLNLRQIVVTYEYRATGAGALVFHARASKVFRSTGTRVGFSANLQQQNALGNFALGGVDFSQKTPNGGMLHLEWARSTGKVIANGSYDVGADTLDRQGNAYLATYDQPFRWRQARLQASFRSAGAGFSNPFGGTVVAGSTRAGVALDLQATAGARLRVGFTTERNRTERVDNNRQTISAQWSQRINEQLTATLAYDYRRLHDTSQETGEVTRTNSQLVTAGFDWRPTTRLTLSIRREQNLGKADPTYPNQTVLSAFYKLNDASRLFVTQALRSAPITPISDLTGGGFGVSQAKTELTAGIETKLMRDTSLVGGYRVEHGVEGSDGYAVLGLARKWKLNEMLALDASYERAFHVRGLRGRGYNTLSTGFTWQPRENFIANTAYQWRDREGQIHTLAAGFAGKPNDNITAVGSFQFSRGSGTQSVGQVVAEGFDQSPSPSSERDFRQGMYGSFGIAVRPKNSDRVAAFFNYQHRSFAQTGGTGAGVITRERSNTLSLDAFFQAEKRLALFGKVALRDVDSSRDNLSSSPTLTYLLQGRAEYRIRPRWDLSLESRFLKQPASGTSRMGVATELGYWVTPDVRFGLGYNFNSAIEQPGREAFGGNRRGFYFHITTKFERVFDFFGARKKAVKPEEEK